MSPVTATKVKLPIQLASRHNRLSAAISEPSRANAVQTPALAPCDSVSTRNLTPYCVPTEQPTAPSTAVRMNACDSGRRRT